METKVVWRHPSSPLTFLEKKGELYDYYVDGELYAWNVDLDTLISMDCRRWRLEQESKEVY